MKNSRAIIILCILGLISFYAVKSGARAWQSYRASKKPAKQALAVNSAPNSVAPVAAHVPDPDPELRVYGFSRSGRTWSVLRHDGKTIEWNVPDEFGWPDRLFFSGSRGFVIYHRDGGRPYRVLLFASSSAEVASPTVTPSPSVH